MITATTSSYKHSYKTIIPFEIRTIEWLLHNRKEQLSTPHICEQFIIVWIQQGALLHNINMHHYKLKNDLFCIVPGQIHQLLFEDNADGYIIYFDADYIQGISASNLLFNSNIFYSHPVNILKNCTHETVQDIKAIFFSLAKEFNHHSLFRSEIISNFLKILFNYLIYQNKDQNNEPYSTKGADAAKRFFILLDKYFKTKKQVSDYASEMAITPSYLNELIKKATGKPASYHIRQRIISEAKQQATCYALSMKETAYFLGFDDLAHFSKYFKNATGKNFSDFKKHHSQHFVV